MTSSLALSFIVYKIVIACSDGPDPYDYYPQFFPPSATGAPAFQPFHYTGWIRYYDDYLDAASDSPAIPDANLGSWSHYTGGNIPLADIDSFVYAFPYAGLSALYYHIEKGKPLNVAPAVASNGMTRWFLQSRDLEALGYLMYAKQCEALAIPKDSWELPAQDTAKRGRLLRNGLQLHKAAKAAPVRERYAYQVLRLAFLNEQYRQTLQLYSSLIGDTTAGGSDMFYRSLGYKAGALFRLGRKHEAAYYYSLVFDGSDALKKSSYMSFDWATTRDKKPVLALCKSPHERAVVHLMDGLNDYEQALPQLRAAYAADPALKGLQILFAREINKMEERYFEARLLAERNLSSGSWWYTRYQGESPYQSEDEKRRVPAWKTYLPQLIAFGKQVGAEGKAPAPGIWKLGTAYLNIVNDDFNAAAAALDASGESALSEREKSLREVIAAVLLIRRAGRLDAKAEAELLPRLQRIEQRGAQDPVYAKIYRDLMSTVIATAYLQHRDTVKAVYALGRIERENGVFRVSSEYLDLPGTLLERMSVAKLQELQAFYSAGNGSAWDRWLKENSAYTPATLREFEGTKHIRNHEWARAASVLRQVPERELQHGAFLSPFVSLIPDQIHPDSNVRVASYTKLQFALEMQELQGKTDAASLFRYGCGLYNMSYYGWAYGAFAYYRSSSDDRGYYEDPERRSLPAAFREYYGVMSAENYFRQAAAAAGDKELKARSLFMAAKCWQKRCPLPAGKDRWELYNDSTYYRNALTNPYFGQLQRESAGTAFFEDASTRCSYLADYLTQDR